MWNCLVVQPRKEGKGYVHLEIQNAYCIQTHFKQHLIAVLQSKIVQVPAELFQSDDNIRRQ